MRRDLVIALLVLAVAGLALNGCKNGLLRPGTGANGTRASSSKADGPTTEPAIDFKKVCVGMPNRTLDYISDKAVGLAGAKEGRKLYFGASNEGTTTLYCRDLDSYQRSEVGTVERMQSATLVCSSDGRYLAYARKRAIKTYIDDPNVTYPDDVALVVRRDIKDGTEEELFDFRDPAFRPYRADQLSPYISADGLSVIALAYNIDRLIISRQSGDWLALEADYRERLKKLEEQERTDLETKMHQLLNAPVFVPLLKEKGITPSAAGEITTQERDAMKAIYTEHVNPQGALLIWQAGQASILPLTFVKGREQSFHFVIALAADRALLGCQDLSQDPASPNEIFSAELKTGVVTTFASYLGAPSTMELDPARQNLRIVYNPIDVKQMKVLTETHLRTLPLDGSAPLDVQLPGDFLSYVDLTADAKGMVVQDKNDSDLYFVNVDSGDKKLLLRLQAEIGGVFVTAAGDRMVYLDAGVLYAIDIPADPQASPQWIGPEHFEPYKDKLATFFTQLGFTVTPDLSYEWEEREGLGEHEVSAQIYSTAKPGAITLLRYSIPMDRVVSVWMPYGYPFAAPDDLKAKDLDFYGAKAIVEQAMDKIGWLNPQTRQEYHPGPNPIYDGKSNSYVVIFRDGYWLDETTKKQWAFNSEVTMRVHANDGSIAEMTISEQEKVNGQPQTMTLEKATFMIRNEGEVPIPEDAPVRFDTQKYRLVVTQKRADSWGPAKFQGASVDRLCYEIDAYIQPEDQIIMTSLVDTETGDVLGTLDYQPTNMAPVVPGN